MSHNTSYADYSNRKARAFGVPTFKSLAQMTETEKRNYEKAAEMTPSKFRELHAKAYKKYISKGQ